VVGRQRGHLGARYRRRGRALTRVADPLVERQLILLSAGTGDRRRARLEQAAGLARNVDWVRLAEMLRWRKLLSTLGPRIVELTDGSTDGAFAAAVDQAVAAGRRQGALLQVVAAQATGALMARGIPSVILKGPVLAEALYGDAGRRLSTDIDLLVPTERLWAAVEVVRGLGYVAPPDHIEESGLPLLHFALVHEHGALPSVELHWRIHWYERSFARERLLPPAANPGTDWRPALEDELVALLLFYARDGFVDLRLATDLGAWWDIYGDKLPRGAVEDTLRAYPAFARAVPVAVRVAERVVGLPAMKIVGDMHRPGLRGGMAMRLADPNPSVSEHQLYADIGLIDGLLAPPKGFGAFIKRKVMPPRGVLEGYALHSSDGKAISPLGYSLRIVVRYGLALIRIARGPERLRGV
jgi:Uncharacterised nucleotidyltransferase